MGFLKRKPQERERDLEYEAKTFVSFLIIEGGWESWSASTEVETRDIDQALALAAERQPSGVVIGFAFFNGGYDNGDYSMPVPAYECGQNVSPMYYIDGEVLTLNDVRRLNEQETHTEYRTYDKGHASTHSSMKVNQESGAYPIQVGDYQNILDEMEYNGLDQAIRTRTGSFKLHDDGAQVVRSK